ncbi:MAG: family 78 glycoside hydrolase catalytic domain [Clostridia bacterium]|nr:family 78 glycoside hydrolase catalytic domain [Clostridia bacterium]
MASSIFKKFGAKPIWYSKNKVNHYVDFKKEFILNSVEAEAKLYIAVDTEYVVFINGNFVDMGAYDDFPKNKAYDVLNIAEYLVEGKNELFITAYAQGIGSFQYINSTPFLMFLLTCGDFCLISDDNILCRENPFYKSGEVELISFQMGYSFEYDASKAQTDFEYATLAKEYKIAKRFYERPIKKCVFENRSTSVIKAQGKLIRQQTQNDSVSEHIKSDYLSTLMSDEILNIIDENIADIQSPGKNVVLWNSQTAKGDSVRFWGKPDSDGIYLIIDLEKMQAGLLELELSATKGTVVDIGYGESLDDMRVRSYLVKSVGRYICKEGKQKFTHYLKRIAGRYIQLHFTGFKNSVELNYCGFIPMLYPVTVQPLNCKDRLFKKIYDVAVNTLRTCMHEHYEDCPIREQGLYGFDGLNQMVFGYYAFKETDMPRESIRLLAEGITDVGLIPLCAPSEWHEKIPMFSIAWAFALEQYYIHTKDIDFVKEMFPTLQTIINTFKGWVNNGVVETPFGDDIWNFYDWDYGLEDNERVNKVNEGKVRIDAPLNFGFCAMLKTSARLAKSLEKDESVKEYINLYNLIKVNAQSKFYNPEKGLYVTFIGGTYPNHYCELSQALALISGISTDEALRDKLANKNNGLIKTNLSLMYYKYEALLQEDKKHLPFILDEIEEIWGNMVYSSATTFWESTRGEDDFEKHASLCHGWSAIPAYILKKYCEE